jgi:glyoxylase-like metal-dependent hydrolase (beta-lactamase superfamily II)
MRVHRLHLTDVTPSPDLPWARPTFPVYGFLVEHADGPVLIDTRVGVGNELIDKLYSPVPGHTPGHQSVLIEDDDGQRTIACCQASWDIESFDAAVLGDDGWDQAAGAASATRLHAFRPATVLLSHDPRTWRPREISSGVDVPI